MRRIIALSFLFLLLFGTRAFAEDKLIVLTFDDGPRESVLFGGGAENRAGLIEILQVSAINPRVSVPAHFFMIGAELKARHRIVEPISQHGPYFFENHTWGHDNLIKLYKAKGKDGVLRTLQKTSDEIFAATGRRPKYLRPPYWAITPEVKAIATEAGYKVVELEKPDINSLDYEDFAKHRSPDVLVERVKKYIANREKRGTTKHVLVFHELPNTVQALSALIPYFQSRGYRFGTLDEYFGYNKTSGGNPEVRPVSATKSDLPTVALPPAPQAATAPATPKRAVKAAYLSVDYLRNAKKVTYIESLLDTTELNAVVIDFKIYRPEIGADMKKLIERFHKKNVYVIGRQVVLQDSYFAAKNPHLAIKTRSGSFWVSGQRIWKRYWVDPASPEVLAYNIDIAKRGIDIGFDEINFDYIRFPSDGNMKDIAYPIWDGTESKQQVMRRFFRELTTELKKHNPDVKLSIDVFGEVFVYKTDIGIGQKLSDIAEFFDVLSPMAYPSHYRCGEFGVHDPNTNPYLVYKKTLGAGIKELEGLGFKGEVRPWIQDFSIANIYKCGPKITYGHENVRAEIRAGEDLGIHGFMLWNASNRYTREALRQK